MFKINNSVINVTRGDIGAIELSIKKKDGTYYTFQVGDVVRFSVYQRKNYNNIIIRKDVEVSSSSQTVNISLSDDDTRIGGIINKPVEYWYEIELNPDTQPQTVIGHDGNGAKIFKLFPEGVENE